LSAPSDLPKRVGLGGALLLSFNGAVGAAVFALPATLAADVGGWAPWLFPLAGLVVLLVAIPFARAAGSMPGHGGPALYGAAFGRLAGFELGWLYYVARTAALAANVHVLVDYLLRWAEASVHPVIRGLMIVSVIALLAAANVAGMSRALRLLGGLTLLKTLPLLGLAGLALTVAPLPELGPLPALGAMEASLLLVFYAFVGFENAAVTAGETRSAERSVPRALLLTVGTVVLLYFLVQLAFVAVSPAVTAGEKAPLLALGDALLGPTGSFLILLAAVTSLLGNLHGNLAATPRVTYALARRGELPAFLGAVHPRFESPHGSVLFMALFASALALSGGFTWLAVVSVLARLWVYAVTVAAWLRGGGLGLGERVMGLAAILLCALVGSQASAESWLTLALLAAAGAFLFLLAKKSRDRVDQG
jgi:amino acid transporter